MLFDGVLAAPDEARKLKLVLEQNYIFFKENFSANLFSLCAKNASEVTKIM
jgi:hypothetical protein